MGRKNERGGDMSEELKKKLESTGYFKQYDYDPKRNIANEYISHDTSTLYYGFRLYSGFADEEISKLKEDIKDHINLSENLVFELLKLGKDNNDLILEDKRLKDALSISTSLVNDLCKEWNEDCEKTCDSVAHEENCKRANLAEAKKAMRLEIEDLKKELAISNNLLEEGRKLVAHEVRVMAFFQVNLIERFRITELEDWLEKVKK